MTDTIFTNLVEIVNIFSNYFNSIAAEAKVSNKYSCK